eukprot:9306141-Pyramimonas_sp.AAC.1
MGQSWGPFEPVLGTSRAPPKQPRRPHRGPNIAPRDSKQDWALLGGSLGGGAFVTLRAATRNATTCPWPCQLA